MKLRKAIAQPLWAPVYPPHNQNKLSCPWTHTISPALAFIQASGSHFSLQLVEPVAESQLF